MATLASNRDLSEEDRAKVNERKDALESEVKRRGALRVHFVLSRVRRALGWSTCGEYRPARCTIP